MSAAFSRAPTYVALLAHLSHLLTLSIHTILYTRHCYPRSTFLIARAYNLPVAQSRHPAVCAWISSAVAAVRQQLIATHGGVARVALVLVHPKTEAVLERYIWDLERLPRVTPEQADLPIVRPSEADPGSGYGDQGESREAGEVAEGERSGDETDTTSKDSRLDENAFPDLTEQFRALLLALAASDGKLLPVPKGCPFTVAIELQDDFEAEPPVGHPQNWVPCKPELQRLKGEKVKHKQELPSEKADNEDKSTNTSFQSSKAGAGLGGVNTVPIRNVEAGEICFEMWIEEGAAKSEALTESDVS